MPPNATQHPPGDDLPGPVPGSMPVEPDKGPSLPIGPLTPEGAARLRNGNPGMVFASGVQWGDLAWGSYLGVPVAVGHYQAGELHPVRVFNL